MGLKLSTAEKPPSVVLVPPFFDRDHSREARLFASPLSSSFARAELHRLLHTHVATQRGITAHIAPLDDDFVSLTLAAEQVPQGRGDARRDNGASCRRGARSTWTSLALAGSELPQLRALQCPQQRLGPLGARPSSWTSPFASVPW